MMKRSLAAIAAITVITLPIAARADEYPMTVGDYVTVDSISIDDGHDLDYAKHLAGMWRKSEDFAVKQGWITRYEILSNDFKRAGEPDIYLVTYFPHMADAAEMDKREKAYQAYMQTSIAQEQAASGERAKYRHLMGSMLLRELKFRD